MDRIYGSLAPAEIPWNVERPPELLVELVTSRRVLPCPAVDLGCGAGHQAVCGDGFRHGADACNFGIRYQTTNMPQHCLKGTLVAEVSRPKVPE